jgi:glycosyltransferase involved in cell wall biosynthesis
MNVGIDVRSTLKRKTGIGYYTLNLVNHLAKVDDAASYYLYGYIRPFDFKRRLPPLPGPNFHYRIDRLQFRPERTMHDMDVFHTSSYDMRLPRSVRLVTTIHDIIPLVYSEGYPDEVLRGLEENLKRVCAQSAMILVDSYHTKKDVEGRFALSGDIKVVYPGRDETFSPPGDKRKAAHYLKQRYGIDTNFVLFVGTIEKRKNVATLIKAFLDLKKEKRLPHLLVIVGMKGWGGQAAFELLEKAEVKRAVRHIGYIRRSDVPLFYGAADVFVYPSSYEGFGFPVLEAFSCGVPTITSDATSCGEIAGEAAVTVRPEDRDELKNAIDTILSDKDLQQSLRKKGHERARLFSWREAAQQFQQIIREVT